MYAHDLPRHADAPLAERLVLMTPPSAALVTRDEAKAQLGIVGTAKDVQVDALIAAALGMLDGPDGDLNRALLTQTWRLETPGPAHHLFCGQIYLRLGPVQSVTSVTYLVNGVDTPWTDFRIGFDGQRARIVPLPNTSWPLADCRREDAFKIVFVAGYGNAAANVPPAIKQAMLLMISNLYAIGGINPLLTRETVEGVGTTEYSRTAFGAAAMTDAVRSLLGRYRGY